MDKLSNQEFVLSWFNELARHWILHEDTAKIFWLQNCPKSFVKACWNHKFLIFLFNWTVSKKNTAGIDPLEMGIPGWYHHTNWGHQKALFKGTKKLLMILYAFLGVGARQFFTWPPETPNQWGYTTLKLSKFPECNRGFSEDSWIWSTKKRNE